MEWSERAERSMHKLTFNSHLSHPILHQQFHASITHRLIDRSQDLLFALLDHLYSCRFSTFLSNCWIDRTKHFANEATSFWGWVEQRYASFLNPTFEAYHEGPVIPSANPKNIVLWEAFFQRFDVAKLPTSAFMGPRTFYD